MNREILILRVAIVGLAVHCAVALPVAGAEAQDSGFTPSDLMPQDANTPVRASRDTQDLQVTERIRGALEADDSLSVFAKNVRVSTNSDAVILRGTVRTNEVDAVEAVAQQYCGMRQIINELSVDDRMTATGP
jgi:Flp pilus assembly secretin CpaC